MGNGNDLWSDPEWDDLRRRINKRTGDNKPKTSTVSHKQQKPVTEASKSPAAPKKVEVSFNVSLPRVRLPKIPRPARKHLIIGGVAAIVLVAGVLASQLLFAKKSSNDIPGVLGGSVSEPEFDTILPGGKKERTDSGKVGYDPGKKVASFKDTIGTVAITVSQQPLPENFKENPDDELKKLAEGFSANEVIAESNPKAYLGTSEKGPQTVIFHKNGLLVFIQSARSIDKDQWAAYITELL